MAISKKNNISAMILQSGINPMTGDYLSAKERKTLFKTTKISGSKVFGKTNIVGAALEKRVISLEQQYAILVKTIKNDTVQLQKQQRERERILKRDTQRSAGAREEKGLESGIKKIANVLVSPAKKIGEKGLGIFDTLLSLFGLIVGGWLGNQGFDALEASMQGNIEELGRIKERVINTLGTIGLVIGGISAGILVAWKLLKSTAKRIGKFAWNQTFGRLFRRPKNPDLGPDGKPRRTPDGRRPAVTTGSGGGTNLGGGSGASQVTQGKGGKKGILSTIWDNTKKTGSYFKQKAVSGAQFLSKHAKSFAKGIFDKIKGGFKHFSTLGEKGKQFIMNQLAEKVKPFLIKISDFAQGMGNKAKNLLTKIPGAEAVKSILKKSGGQGSESLIKKLGGKAIPILGGLVNLAFAYDRLANKDPIGGGIEALSGILDLAGLIPGGQFGPPISMLLDGYMFARDIAAMEGGALHDSIRGGEDNFAKTLGLDKMVTKLKEANLPDFSEIGRMMGIVKKAETQEGGSGMRVSPSTPQIPSLENPNSVPKIIEMNGGGGQSVPLPNNEPIAKAPSIRSSNPGNFYTLYSQVIYNVVE